MSNLWSRGPVSYILMEESCQLCNSSTKQNITLRFRMSPCNHKLFAIGLIVTLLLHFFAAAASLARKGFLLAASL